MKRSLRPWSVLIALSLACLWTPHAAAADSKGAMGRVVRLTINSIGSGKYASFHGAISVRAGSKTASTYYWGGAKCPAQKFTDAQIALLSRAFHDRSRTLVVPEFRDGQTRDTQCLVGFELVAAK